MTATRSFTLTHNPGEWDGTFSVALHSLVTDLLSDAPFAASVTFLDEQGAEKTIESTVTELTEDGDLILATVPVPSAVPALEVITITVSP